MMRTRLSVLAALVCGLAALTGPVLAIAAPRHDRGLTIANAPSSIIAGEGVVIYGHLSGPADAGQTIDLYHRINPAARFTLIGRTTTDTQGNYEFTRQEGVVMSNRSWFVRGPSATHSRTVHERVAALVTLGSSTTNTITGRRIIFAGHVAPQHPYERVLLQQQEASGGNGWRTIASTFTNRGSHFALAHTWARPGTRTLRALFPGDRRNIGAGSDSVTITVQQREKPAFTLSSSDSVIRDGQTVSLTGKLDKPGTSVGEAGTQVILYGATPNGPFRSLGTTTTQPDGSFAFSQTPVHNTVYRVATAQRPLRRSAPVHQGVQDIVTSNSTSGVSTVGGSVTISGSVTPDKPGHAIFLQRLGADGAWHDVARGTVGSGSTYSFTYTFGHSGQARLRARIYGGPWNVGAPSPTQIVEVSGVTPVTSLPSGS